MIEEKRGERREGEIRNKDDEDNDRVRDFISCLRRNPEMTSQSSVCGCTVCMCLHSPTPYSSGSSSF